MAIFKFLANLSTNRRFKKLAQEQKEALVDTLTLAKAIDGELDPREREELMESMTLLDWEDDGGPEYYVEQSIKRAVEVEQNPAELPTYLADISGRLSEDWLKQEAYYLASRVTLADMIVVEEERELLQELVKAFAITADQQQLIIRKIRNEIDV